MTTSLRLFDTGNQTEILVFQTDRHEFRSIPVAEQNHRFYKRNLQQTFQTCVVDEADLSIQEKRLRDNAKRLPVYFTQDYEVSASVQIIEADKAILTFEPLAHPIWLENDARHRAYNLPETAEVSMPVSSLLAATIREWRIGKQKPSDTDAPTKITGYVYSLINTRVGLQVSSVSWQSGAFGAGITFCHVTIRLPS
jgi:hypothetical protein